MPLDWNIGFHHPFPGVYDESPLIPKPGEYLGQQLLGFAHRTASR